MCCGEVYLSRRSFACPVAFSGALLAIRAMERMVCCSWCEVPFTTLDRPRTRHGVIR